MGISISGGPRGCFFKQSSHISLVFLSFARSWCLSGYLRSFLFSVLSEGFIACKAPDSKVALHLEKGKKCITVVNHCGRAPHVSCP